MAAETESPHATTPPPESGDLSRRGVIRGAAAGGLALPVLVACGSEEPTSTSPEPTGAGSPPPEDPGGESGPDALASTGDVPVGGGTVLPDQKVVITQPGEGDFKAFTAVCTHQGCVVSNVADGTINCGCHGSKFSIDDGSVANGPATAPLEEIQITVDGNAITRA